MKREKLYTQIILETLSLLYENSEPKLDFMNFINTTNQYVDKDTNEPVVLEEHISITEMRERGLVVDVPFDKSHSQNRRFNCMDCGDGIIDTSRSLPPYVIVCTGAPTE